MPTSAPSTPPVQPSRPDLARPGARPGRGGRRGGRRTRTAGRVLGGLAGGFLAVVAVLVVVTLVSGGGRGGAPEPGAAAQTPLVREDSHYLSDAGPDAPVLVEFLDLECEGCAAVYPVVEELRAEYEGRLSVVARYFPLPGHANAENAAVAVEAAAQQDAFEPMYQRMYQTQSEWGERQESEAPRFRTFAEDLGLDMAAYDAAVADPATLERVGRDLLDGQDLGVESTPTFFLDGQRLQPTSAEDLRALVEAAVTDREQARR